MRSLRRGTIWSAGRRWLWAGSFGLAVSGTAFGQGYAPECCPESCAVPAAPCEEACVDECGDGCTGEGGCCGGYLFGPDEPWSLTDSILGAESPFTIGGWVQNGYHSDSTGLFNSHPDEIRNHQSYLYAERVADGSEGLGFGFRADVMYGVDAQDTQAFGEPVPQDHWDTEWDHGIYGWALPQLYAEAAYGDLSVIAGKFYTLIGYEVVTAPDNFFYSHSFTMYLAEPFTHTGVLTTYNAADNVTVYNGWVAGWDTGFERFSEDSPFDDSKGSAYIGGASVGLGDSVTATYIGMVGDMGVRGEGYNHSIVIDVALTEKLSYVIQSDLNNFNARNDEIFEDDEVVGLQEELNYAVGVNQYLFYTISDQLAVGGRAEWWRGNQDSIYEVTAGVNYRPMANLVVRPEYRYQWGDPTSLGLPVDQGIFGIDAVLTF